MPTLFWQQQKLGDDAYVDGAEADHVSLRLCANHAIED